MISRAAVGLVAARVPWLTLLIAALATVVRAGGADSWLEFHRAGIAAGQWWRLWTGHLTHFDGNHFRWDVVVWLVLGVIAERQSRLGIGLTLALAAPTIALLIWALQPELAVYRGLSGVDSALFGLVLGRAWIEGLRQRHALSVALAAAALGLFIAKCVWEAAAMSTVFATAVDYVPVPLAHLSGAFVGLGVATRCAGKPRRARTSPADWSPAGSICHCSITTPERVSPHHR